MFRTSIRTRFGKPGFTRCLRGEPSSSTGTKPPCLRKLACAGILFLAVLVVYGPALSGPFVWDDPVMVDRNPLVTGELGLGSVWFQTDFPLTTVAFWLQWLAWGKRPFGYHLVNVLLHAVSAGLLWRVLERLKFPGAWVAALLFAVHPVAVTSVAWITELKNALSLPFYLLSFLAYVRWAEAPDNRRRAGWYGLALGAFLLALLSKTSTVMLPAVLLGYAWWRRGRITFHDGLGLGPFLLLGLSFGLMSIWFQQHQVIGSAAVQTERFWGRVAGAGMAVWFYLGKALLPVNLSLIYPRWTIDATVPWVYLPTLLLLAALAGCWRFRNGWGRHALFGLGTYVLNLFPILGLLDMYFLVHSRVADHFQYVALIAVTAGITAALQAGLKPVAGRIALGAMVLVLAGLSLQRARLFADEAALWRDTLAKNPAAWAAHNNLGCLLAEQSKLEEAIRHFQASLQVNPRNPGAHCNLGRARAQQGNFAEAEEHFLAALEIRPDHVETLRGYADALAAQGRPQEAMRRLRQALRVQEDFATRQQLADLLYQTGQIPEAVAQYRRALGIRPDDPAALGNLAWLLATAADPAVRNGMEAVRLAGKACQRTAFREARLVGTLAAAYAEAGRFEDAVSTAEKAVALAQASGDSRFANLNQQLLRLYRAGRPFHEPPPKDKTRNAGAP